MIRYLITPYDVLMFRESRTFDAGTSHLARSTEHFYSAVAGALRAKIFEESMDGNLIGVGMDEPEFEIVGAFYYRNGTLFSLPMDIAKVKKIEQGEMREEVTKVMPGEISWLGKRYQIFTTNAGLSFERISKIRFLNKEMMIKYLQNFDNFDVKDLKNIDGPLREKRVGIKINPYLYSTEEGCFYSAEFLRFDKELKIEIWLKDDEPGKKARKILDSQGFLKLGGESRFSKYTIGEKIQIADFYKYDESECIKFYVATPIVLPPSFTNLKKFFEEEFKNAFHTKEVSVEGMLLGKPYPISGWDLVKKEPKPTKYVIPSGSVIYTKIKNMKKPSYPLKIGVFKKLGYGLIFTSKWRC